MSRILYTWTKATKVGASYNKAMLSNRHSLMHSDHHCACYHLVMLSQPGPSWVRYDRMPRH